MAPRHWLDPLARSLLQATGQLPASPTARSQPAAAEPAGPTATDHATAVERDLLALKLRQNPCLALASAAEVQRMAELGWQLDVNRATRSDWLRLPGIQTEQVDLLLRLQAGGVQLSGMEDLQRLLNLPGELVTCWHPVLVFRWYGTAPTAAAAPPLDLNCATAQELAQLGLSSERCRRLLRERARRPYRDLADLQERLQLPAALLEGWIGKVSFSARQAGPTLPPPLRR